MKRWSVATVFASIAIITRSTHADAPDDRALARVVPVTFLDHPFDHALPRSFFESSQRGAYSSIEDRTTSDAPVKFALVRGRQTFRGGYGWGSLGIDASVIGEIGTGANADALFAKGGHAVVGGGLGVVFAPSFLRLRTWRLGLRFDAEGAGGRAVGINELLLAMQSRNNGDKTLTQSASDLRGYLISPVGTFTTGVSLNGVAHLGAHVFLSHTTRWSYTSVSFRHPGDGSDAVSTTQTYLAAVELSARLGPFGPHAQMGLTHLRAACEAQPCDIGKYWTPWAALALEYFHREDTVIGLGAAYGIRIGSDTYHEIDGELHLRLTFD